jgi:PAS domain S-box-containing protein
MRSSMLEDKARVSTPVVEHDLEDFFENGSIGLHIVDRNGVIVRANKAELELLGYRAEEYVGRPIAEFHVDAEVIADVLRRLRAGERLDKYPARLRAKDGSIRHVQINSSALVRDGEFVSTRCFTLDVTAAREADLARLEAERRLLNTYESVTVGIADTDEDGRFIRVNAAFEAISGYSRDELLEMSFEQLTHPDDRAQDIARYGEQVEGRLDSYAIQKRYLRKDGSLIHVEVMSSSARGADGAFQYGVRVVKDVTERHEAARRLQDSEQRVRALLDALPMAVYTTDREGRITYCNEAAVEFAGRRPELGVDLWCVTWKLYRTDGGPLPHAECPMALALKSGEELRGAEAVAERPDGTRATFAPYPTLLRDAGGEVIGAINVLVDISERKRAEEAQKTLIDELNHRVKNTLATVQSIAMQTQRSTPEDFPVRFEERLLALSNAHDLLTRRQWSGVGLVELLEREFAPYAGGGEPAIRLEGPDIVLPARVSVAFGMVVHELATNAAKYGSLSNEAGRVDLTWKVEQDAGGRTLALRWVETGGPPTVEPKRRGFGRRLIERNITGDLGGRVDMSFAPTGLQCSLAIPLT